MDAAGKLTYANRKAAQMFGVSAQELLGRAASDLLPGLDLPEPDQSRDRRSLPPVNDIAIGERRFSPTLGATVGLADITVSLRDVTERRQLDERRLDFYSMIAHDLRTPLHAMTLRLAAMRASRELVQLPGMAKHVEKLDARLQDLVSMLGDFLELASLDGARVTMQRVAVDLPALIEQVVDDFRPLLDKSQHQWLGITITGGEHPCSRAIPSASARCSRT